MPSRRRTLLAAAALLVCAMACHAAPEFNGQSASPDAYAAASWVLKVGDHQGRPFAIVDKRDARVYVFDQDGHLLGAAAALLGLTPGDRAPDDMAGRAPVSLTVAERTTPAGRFESQPGHNDKGEAIVWVDYEASLAIHRLRPAAGAERRAARLASVTPDDNRISLGCIVVPVAFYENVVAPSLGQRRGVVYVLPEEGRAQAMFDAITLSLLQR